jgi:hypothetical protein
MKRQGLGTSNRGLKQPGGLSRISGPAIILLAAAVATAPIIFHGSFCGDDFEFHLVSWFDVQQSWLHGIPYPHWMPSANYGAGEPRFMFYPPLTWMLGAALGFVLPWPWVPIAMVFLCLAATGFAVRTLALQALPAAPSTLAGCIALFSGFALFTAYERTAFAELTGGFWIPLVLLFALRDSKSASSTWRRALDGSTVPLAVILAGCWLSNGPVGVMANYLLAVIAATESLLTRSWAHLLRASIAAFLGIALPGLYLIPAAWEQRWADLRAAIDLPVFKIENNWLFAWRTNPPGAPFAMVLHRASMLAATMVGVAVVSCIIVLLRQKKACPTNIAPLIPSWWIPLALIPLLVMLVQIPLSLPIWNLLPKLRFLQYPWRWTLVAEAPMAIFFAAAVWPSQAAQRWQKGTVVAVCGLFFVVAAFFAGHAFLRICGQGDSAADLRAQYVAGGGLEGTDEYEPPDADHWKIATNLPDACLTADPDMPLGVAGSDDQIPAFRISQRSCQSIATFESRGPEHYTLSAFISQPGFMILRLVRYPAWRITVNGQIAVPTDPRDDGLIAIAVPHGPVHVNVDWLATGDVLAGRCVTCVAVFMLLALGMVEWKLSPPRAAAPVP